MADRLLRVPETLSLCGFRRTTLYRLIASDPTFPRPRQITAGLIGFKESEVTAWIEARPVLRTNNSDDAA